MSSTLRTRALCFVIGMVMPVMSASWKPSRPMSQLTTAPVTQTSGTESIQALAMPVTRFVAPGPEVEQVGQGWPGGADARVVDDLAVGEWGISTWRTCG